jgi:multiple sugar transport system substrate-binding protein
MIEEDLSPSSASLEETSCDAMFGGGQLAMVLAGSYMTPEYMTNDAINTTIDLVEFPEFKGVEPNIINGLGYAVYEGTKNEEAAVEFVLWLGSEEAMKIQGEAGAVISARNDAQHFFAEATPELNLAAYTNHADIANPLPVCKSVTAELYDLELTKLKYAYAGEKSLADACKELKVEADALLEKAK